VFGEEHDEESAAAIQKAFAPKLKQIIEHASSHPEKYDKVRRAQLQVSAIKKLMADNIEKVMQRGESFEAVEAKTAALYTEAKEFSDGGSQLRRRLCWQRLWSRALCYALGVAAVVLLALFAAHMAGTFTNG